MKYGKGASLSAILAAQAGPEKVAYDLGQMSKAELVELAQARGLEAEGTKAELLERLEAQDA